MKKMLLLYLFFILNLCCLYVEDISNIDLILYDLKNINTIGYKPIKTIQNNYIFTQGPLAEFKADLSFALVGDGFFKVYNEKEEEFYMRCCFFIINEYGKFETYKNMYLNKYINNDNKIINKAHVEPSGKLIITYDDETTESITIELYVPDEDSENICFGNYYSFSKSKKIEGTKFLNGFIELSAVDAFASVLQLQKEFYFIYTNKTNCKDEYEYNSQIIEQIQNYLIIKSFYKSENFYANFQTQSFTDQTYDFLANLISYFDFKCLK